MVVMTLNCSALYRKHVLAPVLSNSLHPCCKSSPAFSALSLSSDWNVAIAASRSHSSLPSGAPSQQRSGTLQDYLPGTLTLEICFYKEHPSSADNLRVHPAHLRGPRTPLLYYLKGWSCRMLQQENRIEVRNFQTPDGTEKSLQWQLLPLLLWQVKVSAVKQVCYILLRVLKTPPPPPPQPAQLSFWWIRARLGVKLRVSALWDMRSPNSSRWTPVWKSLH